MSKSLSIHKKQKALKQKKSQLLLADADSGQVSLLLNCNIGERKLTALPFTQEILSSKSINDKESQALLDDIKQEFDTNRIDILIDRLEYDIIHSITVPFGLGKVISAYDRVGGNVNTIHNARTGVYATQAAASSYEGRDDYDSSKYHKDDSYKSTNANYSKERKAGILTDYLTGKILDANNGHDLDHVVSAKEVHDDAGRFLAGLKGENLANSDTNLKPTNPTANRSKGADSMEEFLRKKDEKQTRRGELEAKQELSKSEENELRKIKKLSEINNDKAKQIDKAAREEINKKINHEYYTSSDFIKSSVSTTAIEGSKMGFQQAIGCVLVELFANIIIEMKTMMRSDFVVSNWKREIKSVCERVGQSVLSKWRDVINSFFYGLLSGLISNIVTIVINTFYTTAKNLVRMIREGLFSLLKAIKLLVSTPSDASLLDATHEASKILFAGGVIVSGIALEEIVSKWLTTVPFSTEITAVVVGSVTAITTTFSVYLIDKLDLLGVIQKQENIYIIQKLDMIIEDSNSDLLASLVDYKYN